MAKFQKLITELFSNWPLLSQLIRQQMILRYRRTLLGYCWTLINPLMMIFIMGLIFSSLFKEDILKYTAFLFAGMIPWNFINNVVNQTGFAYINNEGLIKKIYIPKLIFPVSIVIILFVDTLLSFLVLFLLIIILGGKISWVFLFTPIALLILFIFALGISLIISILAVFFRDLQYILTVVMQGLFFLTPVIYIKDTLPNSLDLLISLNPLTPFIEIFRLPISYRLMPDYSTLFIAISISLVTFIMGLTLFLSREKKIVFRL